jgi:hypothetical protein
MEFLQTNLSMRENELLILGITQAVRMRRNLAGK